MNNLDTVKLSRLKKIIQNMESYYKDKEDVDISFEFIIANCFPSCYNKITQELQHQYTLGYLEGKRDGAENKN